MKTIVGLFEKYEDADQAISELKREGYGEDRINILTRSKVMEGKIEGEPQAGDVGKTAGAGALSGGALGGILGALAGAGIIAVPGLGTIVAVGSVAATIGLTVGGSGVGAAVGAIIGAMVNLDIPKRDAEIYMEAVKHGAIFVAVEADEQDEEKINHIFEAANALDKDAIEKSWSKRGWRALDDTSMDTSELEE